MEGHSVISTDILARYAADAALGTDGVRAMVEGPRMRHHGVRITTEDDVVGVELHLAVEWGMNVPDVGRAVQSRVSEYLATMADLTPASVDVVVDDIGPPPESLSLP